MKALIASAALLIIFAAAGPTHYAQQRRAQSNQRKPAQTPATSGSEVEEVGEDDILRVTTNLVSVPVSVMDRDGRYIYDLRQEDFRIYENGVEQQIVHFSNAEQPFTVVLLMDTSYSTLSYLDQIKGTANAFINLLRPQDSVLPITFDALVHPLLPKSTIDRAALSTAMERMRTDTGNNGTRLYDAVGFTYQALRRIHGRKAVILFTDGEDTWSQTTLQSNLRDATELDALVFTIHYGASPSATYLRSLAEKTGGRFYEATDIEAVKQSFAAVAEELRRQYSIGYYPKVAARSGEERALKLKVNRPNVGIRMRKSYIY